MLQKGVFIFYEKFWFEFDVKTTFSLPPGIGIGCGVTAIDLDDAIAIMDKKVFAEIKRPPFAKVIENVDVRSLGQSHVIPNMHPPIDRGIGFPLGYD